MVVTRNFGDFVQLAKAFVSADREFPGILFTPNSLSGSDVGGHVSAINAWAEMHAEGRVAVRNTYLWLSPP